MVRFYFHIKEDGRMVLDDEGVDLPDVDAAKREALQCAREMLGDAIKAGKPTVPDALVIADEFGRVLAVMSLITVLPARLRQQRHLS